jgi:hypothetical protein
MRSTEFKTRKSRVRKLIAAAFVTSVCLPIAAFADDASYCKALSDTYRKEVGSSSSTAAGVPEAMTGCTTNPAISIPVLEKALKDNKVTLPKRA